MLLKYHLKENVSNPKVKLVIGQKSVQCRIPFHPIFSQSKQIHIKANELNLKCGELLRHGLVQIQANQSKQFVSRCKQIFGLDIRLNTVQLAINKMVIVSNQNQKILDQLEFCDLLEVIKESFDKTAIVVHSKIFRKLKNYIKNCKRSNDQKQLLQQLLKVYKQCQQLQDDDKMQQKQTKASHSIQMTETSTKEKLKSVIIPTNNQQAKNDKTKTNNRSKKYIKTDNSYYRGPKGKNSFGRVGSISNDAQDSKIYLGINGDSEEGWRRRNRPVRVPALKQPSPDSKDSNMQKQPKAKETNQKKQLNKKTSENSQTSLKKINIPGKMSPNQIQVQQLLNNITVIGDKNMRLLKTWTMGKQKFNFNKLKSDFALLINESIWVKYFDQTLTITKGDNGYIRKTKINLVTNGFIAQGLTINLDGPSNIQDGGDEVLGNPTIQEFTGSDSQFFNVTVMKAYVPI